MEIPLTPNPSPTRGEGSSGNPPHPRPLLPDLPSAMPQSSADDRLWPFLLQLFGVSLGLSLIIKYGGPGLPLPGTSGVALAIVLSVPLGMAGFLAWKQRTSKLP
jgi:hypothetical protein